MAPHLVFYQLLLVALVLVCLMFHVWWPAAPRAIPQTPRKPATPRHKRSQGPKPFPGFIHQPLCEACEQGAKARSKASGSPPPLIRFTRGRQRNVDTRSHFCPDPECSYYGWLGRGNLRAAAATPPLRAQPAHLSRQPVAHWPLACRREL